MVSTYLSYRALAADLPKTLARTASQTQVARDADYYRANIGKITSVDDFLKDQRLYTYAMKANGMSDMIYAKAFMRKVLESDLSDSSSFANALVDKRYVAFAKAFNFGTDGKVVAASTLVQSTAQEDETLGLYSEHRVRSGETAATEVQNFQSRIGVFTSVDGFLRDDRLVAVALTAVGLDPDTASLATVRDVLTSDLSDPNSRANQLGGSWLELAKAFNFATDGSVAGGGAQSAAQTQDLIYRYYDASGNGASPAGAAFKTQMYEQGMAGVTSVDDFLAEDRLYEYALTAFGLDPVLESKQGMRLVLTSDLSDPNSVANQLPQTYRTLAAAFNFAADGSISGSDGAQSAAQLESTGDLYLTHYGDKAASTDQIAASYFQSRMAGVTSVDALFSDSKLYDFLLQSYGLDPETESKATIKLVLESDVSDPKSYANRLADDRYKKLAAAVNFGSDGKVTTAIAAQTDRDLLRTVQLYSSKAGTSDTDKANTKTETLYYNDALANVRSVDDLLSDTRLVAFIRKAYGLEDTSITSDTLRRALTSDPFDKSSFAAKSGNDGLRQLAAAFNFTADGKAARLPAQQAQTDGDLLGTADLYLKQTVETDAGSQNEGVRLALYFNRKAPDITSAFSILADKALFEVVRTALGLPASISSMDIDAQAKLLEKRINFDDFKDPTKVDKFVARFSALYDINNSSPTTSPAVILLGGDETQFGVDQTLLGSIQGLKLGRT